MALKEELSLQNIGYPSSGGLLDRERFCVLLLSLANTLLMCVLLGTQER